MHFRKYLTEEGVFLDREFSSLQDVLEFLSREFAKECRIGQEKILKLLEKREQLSSTWIGNGTILPHNHSPEVKDLCMIFIRCRKPLILDDGNEVKYIFSILTSGSQDDLYLGILQGIGKLIMKQSAEVDRCTTSGELLELFSSSGSSMAAPLTAGDLARHWPRAKDTDTLAAALDQMKRHDVYFLPVFSQDSGKICGVLDLVDLLKAGFPDYIYSLHNLTMLKDFQPVKYFWKNEKDLLIKDFTRDYRPYMIREEISYPEIFFMMIKGNRRHLLVLNDKDELVGVIHPKEIINKMLRP